MIAFAALILIGCGKPPEAEMQAASTAFNAAKVAEADQYVPKAFRTAQDTLNAANAAKQQQDSKFALFRSYSKAKALFVKAEALSKQAETDGKAEKERVKALVTDLFTQAQIAIDDATKALSKAPRGKGSKVDLEMIKNDLTAVVTARDDAMQDFNAGKYLVAKPKVEQVIQRAIRIVDEIAQATAKKAPMPATKKTGATGK
jgi:hypothetical protein